MGIQVVCFDGWSELRKDSSVKAGMYIKKKDVIAVIALLDLYGPAIYGNTSKDVCECYDEDEAKREIEAKVCREGFYQFFAFHETEAWLLSDPGIFPPHIRSAFPRKVQNPEDVNFDEPPSKLLDAIYRQKTGRTYKKVTQGKEFFDKLNPEVAYRKCPHLKDLLDEMLIMAKEKGQETLTPSPPGELQRKVYAGDTPKAPNLDTDSTASGILSSKKAFSFLASGEKEAHEEVRLQTARQRDYPHRMRHGSKIGPKSPWSRTGGVHPRSSYIFRLCRWPSPGLADRSCLFCC